MKKLEKLLKAVANKRRLAILKLLRDKREASVGELADHLRISFKATSKHLLILSKADILDREQKSKQVYYYISTPVSPTVKHILDLL